MRNYGCRDGDPNCQHEYGEEEYNVSPPLKHCLKCKGCTANYPNHPHTWGSTERQLVPRLGVLWTPPQTLSKRTCIVCDYTETVP